MDNRNIPSWTNEVRKLVLDTKNKKTAEEEIGEKFYYLARTYNMDKDNDVSKLDSHKKIFIPRNDRYIKYEPKTLFSLDTRALVDEMEAVNNSKLSKLFLAPIATISAIYNFDVVSLDRIEDYMKSVLGYGESVGKTPFWEIVTDTAIRFGDISNDILLRTDNRYIENRYGAFDTMHNCAYFDILCSSIESADDDKIGIIYDYGIKQGINFAAITRKYRIDSALVDYINKKIRDGLSWPDIHKCMGYNDVLLNMIPLNEINYSKILACAIVYGRPDLLEDILNEFCPNFDYGTSLLMNFFTYENVIDNPDICTIENVAESFSCERLDKIVHANFKSYDDMGKNFGFSKELSTLTPEVLSQFIYNKADLSFLKTSTAISSFKNKQLVLERAGKNTDTIVM